MSLLAAARTLPQSAPPLFPHSSHTTALAPILPPALHAASVALQLRFQQVPLVSVSQCSVRCYVSAISRTTTDTQLMQDEYAPPDVEGGAALAQLDHYLSVLSSYYDASLGLPSCLRERELVDDANDAAQQIRKIVSRLVNAKASNVKAVQSRIAAVGAIKPLVRLASQGRSSAYEALQILCYRNPIICDQLVKEGVVDMIASTLPTAHEELKSAMCYLCTAMVAFANSTHTYVIDSGMVPLFVALCRYQGGTNSTMPEIAVKATVRNRAAAILRNLAHNSANHSLLIQAGAIDVLADIMKNSHDAGARINAAVAVACLVGHEESNPRLQLDEELVVEMLIALSYAVEGKMYYGNFWTVWKLCQGLAQLTVNDRNKEWIVAKGGVPKLAAVLFGKHHNNEAAHRFSLSALWNLAFRQSGREAIIKTPGLVDTIRSILATSESSKTREVAKGALWTLGLEEDLKILQDGAGRLSRLERSVVGEHIMLSYEWGCQSAVLLIKAELEKAGYRTWMDVDKMSGSTLEAMAQAVEQSAAVLVCINRKYKDSQACRTEAEYAFQLRKKIVPLIMEADYKPTGWLGALLGTRLYLNMSDPRSIPNKVPSLIKELGSAARICDPPLNPCCQDAKEAPASSVKPEKWTVDEVEEWLVSIECADLAPIFAAHDINGLSLLGMSHLVDQDSRLVVELLKNELGVLSLGKRLRLIEALRQFSY